MICGRRRSSCLDAARIVLHAEEQKLTLSCPTVLSEILNSTIRSAASSPREWCHPGKAKQYVTMDLVDRATLPEKGSFYLPYHATY